MPRKIPTIIFEPKKNYFEDVEIPFGEFFDDNPFTDDEMIEYVLELNRPTLKVEYFGDFNPEYKKRLDRLCEEAGYKAKLVKQTSIDPRTGKEDDLSFFLLKKIKT